MQSTCPGAGRGLGQFQVQDQAESLLQLHGPGASLINRRLSFEPGTLRVNVEVISGDSVAWMVADQGCELEENQKNTEYARCPCTRTI